MEDLKIDALQDLIVQATNGFNYDYLWLGLFIASLATKIYDIYDMDADLRPLLGYPPLLTYFVDGVNVAAIEDVRKGNKSLKYKRDRFRLHASISIVVNAVELLVTSFIFYVFFANAVEFDQIVNAFK